MSTEGKIGIAIILIFIGLIAGAVTWTIMGGPYAWDHCKDWTQNTEILDDVRIAENGDILCQIISSDEGSISLWLDSDGALLK